MIKEHNYGRSLPPNKYNPLSWIHPNAKIGKNCWIGSDVMISENVVIGDNVSIACGTKIVDHDTSYYRVTEGKAQVEHFKIVIGSNSHTGSNSVILAGKKDVILGNHVIVGALSLVNRSFSSNVIIAGVPAKVIKFLGD